ncbi:MAG TPA: hypothetical protein VHB74_12590 [Devosia sp.]|nr:hypothetical protein [Devosia sp.]
MAAMERVLRVTTIHGTTPVPVRLEMPFDDYGSWRCDYSIGWPEGAFESYAMGADAIQAMHLALQWVGWRLYTSPHHEAGNLHFGEPGTG